MGSSDSGNRPPRWLEREKFDGLMILKDKDN